MAYCTNCGEITKANICTHCGVKNNKVHNYCYWCGEQLNAYASLCPHCKERISLGFTGIIWTFLSVIWILFCSLLVVGCILTDDHFSAFLFFISAAIFFPICNKFIKKLTFAPSKKFFYRVISNLLRIILAFTIFIIAIFATDETTTHKTGIQHSLSSYTYDEYTMYSTMTIGYGEIMDSLKNPKSADFIGISYDPDNDIAYFCVIAENDFGGKTKTYIQYSRTNNTIYENDSLKYDYDSAEIQRSLDDLFTFIKAVENSDNSDIPIRTENPALESYSDSERKMYELLIDGEDILDAHYNKLCIIGYKYSTKAQTAYFYFVGEEYGSMVSSYASYSDKKNFNVTDAIKSLYEDADVHVTSFQITNYREAIKKDITK